MTNEEYHDKLITQINAEFEAYRQQLHDNKKLSDRVFGDMIIAIHGCKICINNAIGKVSTEVNQQPIKNN